MLANKVSELRSGAEKAIRVADFWRVQIERHGEATAEAFYTSLGLNHLEKKSVEWEGLTLSREPTETEKLCIKSIAVAQEAGKASVSVVLLKARADLIDEALKGIKRLTTATYHELILSVPDKFKNELRDQLAKILQKGRLLVAVELNNQKSIPVPLDKYLSRPLSRKQSEEDDGELDDLTDLTDSRIANEVQTRITSAVARYALLGLTGAALWKAVRDEINAGSVSYIDRASQGVANRVLNMGRMSEMDDRKDEIGLYEYSAILDQNTCGPCAQDDGQEASSPDDLPDTPNPECDGSDFCRCFIVAILDTVA